jgi:hypothetical protein
MRSPKQIILAAAVSAAGIAIGVSALAATATVQDGSAAVTSSHGWRVAQTKPGDNSGAVKDMMKPGDNSDAVKDRMKAGDNSEAVKDRMKAGDNSGTVKDRMKAGDNSESVKDRMNKQ